MTTKTTRSAWLHAIQRSASGVTFVVGILVGAATLGLLLLQLLLLLQQPPTTTTDENDATATNNISTVQGGSRTAILALWARSQAHDMLGGPDFLAPRLLEAALPISIRPILLSCAWLSRFNFQWTGAIFEDQVATLATLGNTGLVAPMHCRTCWFDDCVEAFLRINAVGPKNIIILGSGYDSRAYRLASIVNPKQKQDEQHKDVRVFEVDAPGTLHQKQHIIMDQLRRQVPMPTDHVQYVACDFEANDWIDVIGSLLDPTKSTLVIWEGVTMYLSESTVRRTLQNISQQPGKWYIAWDYINADWARSKLWTNAMSRAKEAFQFSANSPHEIEELVQACGLEVLENLSEAEELERRYIPEQWPGKPIGRMGNYGGFVVAASQSVLS